jgi:transposase
MVLSEKFGETFCQEDFIPLYPKRGQWALDPVMLLLVVIIQFTEGLSDRQVVEAICTRIDLKYFLRLPLEFTGFHYSVLSEFRTRLCAAKTDILAVLFDKFLVVARENGLLKTRKQRTDSTHVLSVIRRLNRHELIHETMRATLDDLTVLDRNWLKERIPSEWLDRYQLRVFNFRLPKTEKALDDWTRTIATDGFWLLQQVDQTSDRTQLQDAVANLRRVWEEQFTSDDNEGPRLRQEKEYIKSPADIIVSPHDTDARFGNKGGQSWPGFKSQITETYEDGAPHLITDVQTTSSTTTDSEMLPIISESLKRRELKPELHTVDAGYTANTDVLMNLLDIGINVVGPAKTSSSWQARSENGFDQSEFRIDWDNCKVVCPNGVTSIHWSERKNKSILVGFPRQECLQCPVRSDCTKSKTGPRTLQLQEQSKFTFLSKLREREETSEYKEEYAKRAGIEGTISQFVRRTGIRQSRYAGLKKTHLQAVASALGINMVRVARWVSGLPLAKTRTSRLQTFAIA